ncbi:MAG: hypothetical protein GQ582_08015 [Methyloprofundus sp.]|nr:hypothetical protein [Methyloprofundus sp.]
MIALAITDTAIAEAIVLQHFILYSICPALKQASEMRNLIKKLLFWAFFILLSSCTSYKDTSPILSSKEQSVQVGRFFNELGFTDPTKIKSNVTYEQSVSSLVKQALQNKLRRSGYQIKNGNLIISGKIHRIWGQNKVTFILKDSLTNKVLLEKLYTANIERSKLSNKDAHKENLHVLMNSFLQDEDVTEIITSYNTATPITPTLKKEPIITYNAPEAAVPILQNVAAQIGIVSSPPLFKDELIDKKRIALVIGNSDYKIGYLKNPKNDAIDIAKALQNLDFSVILEVDATQEEMDSAILRFSKQLRAGDIGLFYYAGHGVQVEGSNFLIPIAAPINEERDVKYRATNLSQVLEGMRDSQSSLNIIVIDACRDNPLPKSSRSTTRGLTRVASPPGSIIIYSTSPGAVASDGMGRNGLFTKHLLRFIATPNSPIESILKQVSKGVQHESKNQQVPWVESSFTGDFYFLKQSKIIQPSEE